MKGMMILALAIAVGAAVAGQRLPEEQIFGHQLMTEQEIRVYRQHLQGLDGAERQAFLEAHRELMYERAARRGVVLEDVDDEAGGFRPGAREGAGLGPARDPGFPANPPEDEAAAGVTGSPDA